MYVFLQLSFLQIVVFPALISGSVEFDLEESALSNLFHNNEDVESSIDSIFSSPELRLARRKPQGSFYIHTPENPKGVEFFFGIISPYFKNNTPTKIITHGYNDNKERIHDIVKEYLNSSEELNILTYLWEFNSGLSYKTAARLSDYFGRKIVGPNIPKLYEVYEIKPDDIHLIGYNIGAHLFGSAGRVQKLKIGRITGLDPARLCYEVLCKNIKLISLSKNDAKFVDIIHTNGKGIGIFEPSGTVDFYPNGGVFQPQCIGRSELKTCSSILSYVYYTESIKKDKEIWAQKCSSFETFLKKGCEKNPVVLFGEYVNLTAHGSYFFQTRSKNIKYLGKRHVSLN